MNLKKSRIQYVSTWIWVKVQHPKYMRTLTTTPPRGSTVSICVGVRSSVAMAGGASHSPGSPRALLARHAIAVLRNRCTPCSRHLRHRALLTHHLQPSHASSAFLSTHRDTTLVVGFRSRPSPTQMEASSYILQTRFGFS